jgi:hypothetical protein
MSGKLVKEDYGKLRVLFDMTDFHGWDVGAAWEDIEYPILRSRRGH